MANDDGKDENVLHIGMDLGTSRSAVAASNGQRAWVESYVGWPEDFVLSVVVSHCWGRECGRVGGGCVFTAVLAVIAQHVSRITKLVYRPGAGREANAVVSAGGASPR